ALLCRSRVAKARQGARAPFEEQEHALRRARAPRPHLADARQGIHRIRSTGDLMSERRAYLALADGPLFPGRAFGARSAAVGEVVFTTGMTGYQEVLTDPSYCGQIVTMTAPQIGNTGINEEDPESVDDAPQVAGFVIRDPSEMA